MNHEMEEKEVIDLCQQLVRCPSYSGEEEGVVEILEAFFDKAGFDEVGRDAYGNVYGKIKGNRPGKTLLFDGHMDTVPVGDVSQWQQDPYGGEIVEGRLYGRGTTDMKGALAAMATAARQFNEACEGDFAGEIVVAGIVHEECFEGIGARSMSQLIQPDMVIIGEASHLNIKVGQRGRAEIVVETFGVPAHSANPEEGKNAVYAMSLLIDAIRQLQPTEHEVLGKGILELTDIKSSPYPGASVVPSYCRVTYDRRLLVGEDKTCVLEPIEQVIEQEAAKHDLIEAKVSYAVGEEACYTGATMTGERFFPGWLFDQDREEIKKIQATLEARGQKPIITTYNFCTNGSHYAGEAGIFTIGLGPSVETLAHKIDEYVELDQLTGALSAYKGIMDAMLRG